MLNYQHMYYLLLLSVTQALKKLPQTESTVASRRVLESAIHLAEEHQDQLLRSEHPQKKRNTWLQVLVLLLLFLLAVIAFLAGLFYAAIILP